MLRERTFALETNGVRVKKTSFFGNNEIFYPIEEIGPHIQYDKKPILFNSIISLIMLVAGIRILINATTDDFVFIVGTSLIGGAIYWMINTVINLNYIGSYYFSYTTKKDKTALEVKSPYPGTENLKLFLNEIIKLQIDRRVDRLVESINTESKFIHLENRAKEIKRNAELTVEEYEEVIKRIKQKMKKVSVDNKL